MSLINLPHKHTVFRAAAFLIPLLVHLRFISDSIWFDEAAVLDNSSKYGIFESTRNLNWLQAFQPGYSIIVRQILSLPFSIHILKLLSLSALLGALIIFERIFCLLKIRPILYLAFSFLISFNEFSLEYGTMVKPYMFDLLSCSLAIYAIITNRNRLLFLVLILSPVISTTFFPLSIAVILYLFNRKKFKFGSLLSAFISIEILLITYFKNHGIDELFKEVWFGNTSIYSFANFKGTVYQVFAIIAETFDENQPSQIVRRIQILMLMILAFTMLFLVNRILTTNKKEFLTIFQIAVYYALIIFALQILQIAPIALRLNFPLIVLTSLAALIMLNDHFGLIARCLLVISVVFAFNNALKFEKTKSGVHRLLSDGLTLEKKRIFTDIWSGPGTSFLLNGSNEITVHAEIFVEDGKLIRCPQSTISIESGDYIIVNIPKAFSEQNPIAINGLDLVSYIDGTALYEFKRDSQIQKSSSIQNVIFCRYKLENPNYPMNTKNSFEYARIM